jgi:methylated-DNA-[protein]-cysteine S-methyltransferase
MSQDQSAPIWHTVIESALGDLTLVRDADGLRGLYFTHHWYQPDPATFGPRHDDGFTDTSQQLAEYLGGARRTFELPLVLRGDSLQTAVWGLIAQIRYGVTTTYGELATEIGDGVSAQQVGAAVGRNPLSIIVPCHRVLGRNGKLTGYAGGLARKRYLLDLEHEQVSRSEGKPFQGTLMSALPSP